ncbi:hypothetical protein BMJ24_34355, partial [Sinorhizobium medicae]
QTEFLVEIAGDIILEARRGEPRRDSHAPDVSAAIAACQQMQGDLEICPIRTISTDIVACQVRYFPALQHIVHLTMKNLIGSFPVRQPNWTDVTGREVTLS